MKKFKLFVCMIFFVSMIVACDDTKEEKTTTVCKGVVDELDLKMTLKGTGDKLEKQIEEFNLSLTDLGMVEEDMDVFMAAMLKETYGAEDVKGTKGEYEVKDGVAYLTFTVDYNKVDLKTLEKAGFIEKGLLTTEYISLEKSMEAYKEQGLTCK